MALSERKRRPLIPALVALVALGVGAEIWYSQKARVTENRLPESKIESGLTSASPAPSLLPEPSVSIAPRIPHSLVHSPQVPPTNNSTAQQAAKQETFAAPDEEATIEIDRVSLMLRDYRTIAGENPVGTNAEIMAAIMGQNPKQAKLGPPEGMKLNDKGELLDRWGTPYFFHQISKDHMEIRSAGPDKILWTEDDPVVR